MTDKPPEWSIRCPWCNAPAGSRCTSPRGRRLPIDSHDARINAARRIQEAEETPA